MMINRKAGTAVVVVPTEYSSMAIGKNGVNVKLLSKLLGMQIHIRSEAEMEELKKVAVEKFKVLGISEKVAQILSNFGFRSIVDIATADFETIKQVPGLTEAEARAIWEKAKQVYFETLRKKEEVGQEEKPVEKEKSVEEESEKKEEKVEG